MVDGRLGVFRAREVARGFSRIDASCIPPLAGAGSLAIDASFSRDPCAVAAVGVDTQNPDRLVLGHVERWLPERAAKRQRKTREDVDRAMMTVLERIAGIATRFDAECVVDQHLPHVVEDELRKRGVRDVTVRAWSAQNRSDAFGALRARAYTGRLSLYDDGVLIPELLRCRTQYRAGSGAVVTPRTADGHCDEAIALACAVWHHDRDTARAPGWPQGWTPAQEPAMTVRLANVRPGFMPRERRARRWFDKRSTSISEKEF